MATQRPLKCVVQNSLAGSQAEELPVLEHGAVTRRGPRLKASNFGLSQQARLAMDSESNKTYTSGWNAIPKDILAMVLVLTGMPADEVLRNVSFVCRSWGKALTDPCCWSDVDLDQWCRRVKSTDKIDEAVMKLLTRSERILRSLSVYKLGNPAFSIACSSGILLRVLRIPMSKVTDEAVKNFVDSLPMLEELDISYCLKISYWGIHHLGKCCDRLVKLKRNMPPPEFMIKKGLRKDSFDQSEAIAVAFSMPRLEHLELAFGMFDHHGLGAIISYCKALHVLDIRGCWNVRLEGNLKYLHRKIEEFKDPWEALDPWEDENDIFL